MIADDPNNAMLDALERMIEVQISSSPQMRTALVARMQRMLPELVPARIPASEPKPAPQPAAGAIDTTGPLIWREIIATLQRARLTAAESARRDQLVAHAEQQIAATIAASKRGQKHAA